MSPASLRSIAYPWSRSGLRPDFVLGFTERAYREEVRASKPVQGSPGILARRVPPDASAHPRRSHLLDQHRSVAAGTLDALHVKDEARSVPEPDMQNWLEIYFV